MVPFLSLVVADVMTPDPVSVEPSTPIREVRKLFHIYEYDALPVVAAGAMLGWISQFSLLKAFLPKAGESIPCFESVLSRSADTIMQRHVVSVRTVDTLAFVLHRMIDTGCHSFPVVDVHNLLGVIAREDLLKGLDENMPGR